MTHSELCEIAKKWLVRSNRQHGHGCHVALSECRSGWGGEMPDAIGYRAASGATETVVVEVKTSRADFLADAKKPHRVDGEGMGLFRYFMCPEGLIRPDEVPGSWGLLWVNGRGKVTAMLGPVALWNNRGTFDAVAAPWRHSRNTERETWLLVMVMAKIDNPDKVKNAINSAKREQARLAKICNDQAEEIRTLKMPKPTPGWGSASAGEMLTAIRRKVAPPTS
ncbi:adenylosuccinate synthase [Pseudomonas lactis]